MALYFFFFFRLLMTLHKKVDEKNCQDRGRGFHWNRILFLSIYL